MTGRGRKGGGRKGAPSGELYTHHTHLSSIVEPSRDGRRAVARTTFLGITPSVPEYHQEDTVTNAAVEADDFSFTLGDLSLPQEPEAPAPEGIDLTKKKKKPRNENSVQCEFKYR